MSLNTYRTWGYVQLITLHIYYVFECFLQQLEKNSLGKKKKKKIYLFWPVQSLMCNMIFGLHLGACSGSEGSCSWFLCAGFEYYVSWQVQINMIFYDCDFTYYKSNCSEDDWFQQIDLGVSMYTTSKKEWLKLVRSSSVNHTSHFYLSVFMA